MQLFRLAIAGLLAIVSTAAFAQSSPGFSYGQVPTAGQWNNFFSRKQDVLGYTPLSVGGGAMTGPLSVPASSLGGAGLNLGVGLAPGTPRNGDLWISSNGLFTQVGGSVVGPMLSGSKNLSDVGNPSAALANIGGNNSANIKYAAPWSGTVPESIKARLDAQGAYVSADTTGATDAAPAINAALASGASTVILRAGTYSLISDWIEMRTPGQTLQCMDGVRITVVRPGYSASPALIMYQTAKGARVVNCNMDHNGAQFVDSAWLPLSPTDKVQYVPGTGVINNPLNKAAKNDALAVTALVMCDRCEISGGRYSNGWDNSIMVGNYDVTASTIVQNIGPYNVRIVGVTTDHAGAGAHIWTPNFYMGCGIDIGTGVDAIVDRHYDEYSRIGLCVDEGGGASATISNSTSFQAQMTQQPFTTAGAMGSYYPSLSDPWHGSTISGSGIFVGSSTRSAVNGNVQAGYHPTTFENVRVIEPQGVGVWFSRFSNGTKLSKVQIVRPGLECFWALGGTHDVSDSICDQANYLKGSTSIWGASYPWPQVPAVRTICANGVPFSSGGSPSPTPATLNLSPDQLNTTLNFVALRVRSTSQVDTSPTPNYSYAFVTDPPFTGGTSATNCNAAINASASDVQPGAVGSAYENAGSPVNAAAMPNGATARSLNTAAYLNVQSGSNGSIQLTQASGGVGSLINYSGQAMNIAGLATSGVATGKLVKSNGANTPVSAAVAGTDYLAPNGNGSALTGMTASQITGLAPSATTDTTNAANIASGVLPLARVPSTLGATNFSAPIKLPSFTVSALPTCNAGAAGSIAYVTDASSPAFNASLTGGGSTAAMALCNGSAWTAH